MKKEIITILAVLFLFSLPLFLLGYFIAKNIVLGIVICSIVSLIFCLLIGAVLSQTIDK